MSEPSHWGPPGFAGASRPGGSPPTVPLPPVPHSPVPRPPGFRAAGPYPTAQYPPPQHSAPQYPTGLPPTLQAPIPNPQPDYRDYRDYPDDHGGDYRDDYADDRRDTYSSRRPRSRGQIFAGVVLVLAVIVSTLLGVQVYQILASVDLVSADPFAGFASGAMSLGAAAVGAVLVFVLALVALGIARPKTFAGFGLAASLVLPIGAVVVGLVYGGTVLQQNVQNDLAAEGAAAVDSVAQELERRGVDPGPLRDLVVWVVGQQG